jgi:hypothetical protein
MLFSVSGAPLAVTINLESDPPDVYPATTHILLRDDEK